MAMTPQVPNFSQSMQTAKSFWDSKSGSFGKWVLVIGGLGLAAVFVFFWGLILPFLIGVVGSTIQLAGLCAVLAVLSSPLWCAPVRLMLSNAFQMSMRWGYRKLVQKDPIGILLNNRDQMRDQLTEFDKAVTQLAGSKQRLETDLQTQMDSIRENKSLDAATAKQISLVQASIQNATGNSKMELALKLQSLQLGQQNDQQAAGICLQTINAEKPILDQTDKMYDQLCRLRNLADFKVQSLTMQADMYAKQRKSILAGQAGLVAAGHVMHGDPHELELVDMAIDALNTETADTIGAMKDFNRNSDKYLTNMDIHNDADASSGQKVFSELEEKLALPPESVVGVGGAQPTVTASGALVPSDNDYMSFLK